jgi:hypothetical protein
MSISGQAYALALLHAAAHPSSTVLGLLLGTAGPEVVVTDALPLIHRNAALSPTAELGLALARERAKGAKMTVVGIYVAQSEEGGLGRAGEALLKALKADVPGAVALLVS